MLDLGWQEFMLIAVVAVIVVGPKDLPKVIRTVTTWIRKARSLASDFQRSLDEVAREAELDELRKQAQSITKGGVSETIKKTIDEDGTIEKSLKEAREESGAEEAFDEARRIAEQTRSYANSADIPPDIPPEEPSPRVADSEPATATPEPSIAEPSTAEPPAPRSTTAETRAETPTKGAPSIDDGDAGNDAGKRVSTRGVPKPVRSTEGAGEGAGASMAEI